MRKERTANDGRGMIERPSEVEKRACKQRVRGRGRDGHGIRDGIVDGWVQRGKGEGAGVDVG